ncbi:MAG TPA: hypothetical protein VGG02_09380 [Chthoniobacterales bacterium]
MPKEDPIKDNNAEFSGQLQTFKNNVTDYSAVLGLSAGAVSGQAADADYIQYCVLCQNIALLYGRQWTAWLRGVRSGHGVAGSGAPVAPTLPTAVPAVSWGVEARFRALRQNVLDSSGYNPPIGEALGVIGAEMTRPDFGALKPRLKPKVSGNAVLVGWSWDGNGAFLDMIRLEVDRGDGKGFVLLAMDTTPNYTDTAPFPATPAKWTYRAMYYVGDNGVGQWSDPASVMVGA